MAENNINSVLQAIHDERDSDPELRGDLVTLMEHPPAPNASQAVKQAYQVKVQEAKTLIRENQTLLECHLIAQSTYFYGCSTRSLLVKMATLSLLDRYLNQNFLTIEAPLQASLP
jgi:hypothetical protein